MIIHPSHNCLSHWLCSQLRNVGEICLTFKSTKIFIQRKDKTKIDFEYYIIDDYNYDEVIHNADVCIVHGGAGTIFKCLNENKKIIIFPRLKKYDEHVDYNDCAD